MIIWSLCDQHDHIRWPWSCPDGKKCRKVIEWQQMLKRWAPRKEGK